MKKIEFKVYGMHCGSCSANVQKKVSSLEGVKTAFVSIANEHAMVEFDDKMVNQQEIFGAIESIGYSASLLSDIDYDAELNKKKKQLLKDKWQLILVACCTVPLLIIAMLPMLGVTLPEVIDPGKSPVMNAFLQLLLASIVMVLGANIFVKGTKGVKTKSPNMDTLVSMGTVSAFAFSIYGVIRISLGDYHMVHSLYFETAAVIITLVLFGRFIEALSKGKTNDTIQKLMELTPKTATVIRDNEIVEVLITDVVLGDIVLVKAGERIPVDGVIAEGATAIDESMLTGESIPSEKRRGDGVHAGSVNSFGVIKVSAEKVGGDTLLSQIIHMVESAQSTKAPIAKLADKVSAVFVPIVLIIAVITALVWAFINPSNVLLGFISVLVIACPCALGLATPASIIAGIGKAAEYGILFKNGQTLEITSEINTIVLDKTGTITKGDPSVTDIIAFDGDETAILLTAASMEQKSEHPIGKAILAHAKELDLSLFDVVNFEVFPGGGIKGIYNNHVIEIGNKSFVTRESQLAQADGMENSQQAFEKYTSEGKTVVFVAVDNAIIGLIAIADVIRDNAVQAIKKIEDMGIEVYMLTGDNGITASAIAKQVEIKSENVIAEVLPDQKADVIKRLKSENRKRKIAMVGDGINDAPALATSHIGIAIGSGTDIAIEAADIVLMQNNLEDIAKAIYMGHVTIRNVKQNLFWAFLYNVLCIPIAAGVFTAFGFGMVSPMFAAAAMAFSSVSVLLNALRLRFVKLK